MHHGNGHYRCHDGTEYIGEFRNDEKTGRGKEILPTGEWYEGDFLDGRMHG